jgi:hypothetical protein
MGAYDVFCVGMSNGMSESKYFFTELKDYRAAFGEFTDLEESIWLEPPSWNIKAALLVGLENGNTLYSRWRSNHPDGIAACCYWTYSGP